MNSLTLPRHAELHSASRVRGVRNVFATMTQADWLLLIAFGAVAGLMSTTLDFSLRVPSHAILRAVFPLAAGLAVISRTGAGSTMSVAAGVAAGLFSGKVWFAARRTADPESSPTDGPKTTDLP